MKKGEKKMLVYSKYFDLRNIDDIKRDVERKEKERKLAKFVLLAILTEAIIAIVVSLMFLF